MTNSRKYIAIALTIAILLASAMIAVALWTKSVDQQVYADYDSDYNNNPNAIVNFNQYVENSYVNYSSVVVGFNNNQITFGYVLEPNHIFYVKYNVRVSGNNAVEFGFRPNGENNLRTDTLNANNSSLDYVITNVNKYSCLFAYTNGTDTRINCMCIDLTTMYGQNSEPDLEECRRIFTANYYQYTLGTPVAYSQMNAFAQGVDSVISQLDTTISSVSIVNTAQPYLGDYRDSYIQYYTNTGNYPETRYTDILVFKNACYIPFLSSIEQGTTITFKSGSIWDRDLGDFRCSISVIGDNGQLALVDTLQAQLDIQNYSYTYSLPFACNGIVIQNLDTADKFLEFIEPTIEFQSTNISNILANSYQSGYDNAKSYYDNYYGYGGTGYNDIYNTGYQTGLNIQLNEANRHFYTFPQFLGALFDVPVKTITSLLDFEVLGFNLKNFFFSLITLSIIFALIKFILVRTGDK